MYKISVQIQIEIHVKQAADKGLFFISSPNVQCILYLKQEFPLLL